MTADGSSVFMRVFLFWRGHGCSSSSSSVFFVRGRLSSARGSRSVQSAAHWLRFNVFIYSFIYLFSLRFPPSDAHCLLSSLFPPPRPPTPQHIPRFISTEWPDEVINTLVQFAAVQWRGCGYLPCANWTCANRHASWPLMGNGYTTPHRRL